MSVAPTSASPQAKTTIQPQEARVTHAPAEATSADASDFRLLLDSVNQLQFALSTNDCVTNEKQQSSTWRHQRQQDSNVGQGPELATLINGAATCAATSDSTAILALQCSVSLMQSAGDTNLNPDPKQMGSGDESATATPILASDQKSDNRARRFSTDDCPIMQRTSPNPAKSLQFETSVSQTGDRAASANLATQVSIAVDRKNNDAVKATVRSLETYLVGAAADLSPLPNKALTNVPSSDAMFPSQSFSCELSTHSRQSAVKVLTIELSPESLGTVTAKLRISGSKVSVELNVQTHEARSALEASRSRLTEAMQSGGCNVDSCDIKISLSQASPDNTIACSHKESEFSHLGAASWPSDTPLEQYDRQNTHHRNHRGEDQRNSRRNAEVGPESASAGAIVSDIYW
jgi:flagellar hook-length control protein FliK